MGKDVIVALDFSTEAEVYAFLDGMGEHKPYVKVGMELFYAVGPEFVRELKQRGNRVFLDLKLHDIPNTVGRAMANLSQLGADMVNLHAAGGSEMMRQGLAAVSGEDRPLLIAVTQLTSIDEVTLKDELLIGRGMEETVLSYAGMTAACGLDGVVCSPFEAADIKRHCGMDFLTITPGIRFEGESADDQKRVATPAFASENGSDYIVVGRAITQADNPKEAYERCVREFLH